MENTCNSSDGQELLSETLTFDVVYQDQDLIVAVEWYNNIPMLHHDIFNWNKTTSKKFTEAINNLCKLLKDNGINGLWSYHFKDDKNINYITKSLAKYNFKHTHNVENIAVYVKEI